MRELFGITLEKLTVAIILLTLGATPPSRYSDGTAPKESGGFTATLGGIMMAMFFAQRVILGKTTFAQVPAKLKEQVREILIDSGLEELIEE